jgi:nucleoid-associated protein YgaU
MYCHEARHLLEAGVKPGSAEAVQVVLGFHLASCTACRAYRMRSENRQLLMSLLAEPPVAARVALRPLSRPPRRPARGLRATSAALTLSAALALLPAAQSTPAAAAPARPAVASAQLVQRGAALATHQALADRLTAQSLLQARAHNDTALLAELLSQPVAPRDKKVPTSPRLVQRPAAAPESVPAVAPTTTELQQSYLGNYVVQPGDTLSGIAAYFYGNGAAWGPIFNANRNVIANASLIYPGQVLAIPTYTPPGTSNPPQSGQGGTVGRTHVVQRGDTLSGIALHYYGHADWRGIHQANASIIPNPNLIYPGQVLRIP